MNKKKLKSLVKVDLNEFGYLIMPLDSVFNILAFKCLGWKHTR